MSSASKKLIQASGGAAGPVDTGDDDFANVVLLLDGDGTSGDDNNTFTDSSTNGHTVTETGSVVQGSFSPYGDNWSNYFDGSGDYFDAGTDSSLALGNGDFTFEFWIYHSSATGSNYAGIYSNTSESLNDANGLRISNYQTDATRLVLQTAATAIATTASGTVNIGQWNHVAVVRSGSGSNNITIYVNGASAAQGTSTANFSSAYAYVGTNVYSGTHYSYEGYISNLRVVPGTAVYTSGYTAPASPLTAITNTSLLTCQSNRFVDNSSNNHTVTVSGTPKVTPFSPFKDDDARDITVDGGSGYKAGNATSDYLVTQDALSISNSSNWTAECWIYLGSNSTRQNFFLVAEDGQTVGNQKDFQFEVSTSSKLTVRGGNGTSTFAISETNDAIVGAWTHIAAVQNSGTITFYVNGSSVGTDSLTPASIGGTRPAFLFRNSAATSPMVDGYIADARIVVGSSLYTTNFTPPTSPLTAVTNTELLLNFQDAGIYDRTGISNLDAVGNVQIDTNNKKYGTGSLEFDGAGDYLVYNLSNINDFGSGDFTVECWFYLNGTGTQRLVSARDNNNGLNLGVNSSTKLSTYYGNGTSAITGATISTGAWNHVALVRYSGTATLYLNGVSQGSVSWASKTFDSTQYRIGNSLDGRNETLNGYIDDLRITNGVARYTSNFTPPTAELPKF